VNQPPEIHQLEGLMEQLVWGEAPVSSAYSASLLLRFSEQKYGLEITISVIQNCNDFF